MTTLREAAQQALEALEALQGGCTDSDDGTVEAITVWCPEVIGALRAALAEPEGGGNLPPPLQAVAENATTQIQIEQTPPSDYRRGYWDGFNIGKREGRIEAEDAAALAEPVQEPVAWECLAGGLRKLTQRQYDAQPDNIKRHYTRTAPPQRKPLTQKEAQKILMAERVWVSDETALRITRAVEAAHGIKE